MMGRIAAELARMTVLTNEDPRGEDPEAILEDIARGAEGGGKRRDRDLFLIADRPTALAIAFERSTVPLPIVATTTAGGSSSGSRQ